jgi:hypothetical protein
MSDQGHKNSADTDDTMQATPSGEEPETTASDTATMDGNELAWSLDETAEAYPARHGRVITVTLVALVCIIAAAATWLAATLFDHAPAKPGKPAAIPTTAALPAPPPVAVPPPATQPTPASTFTDEQDQRLLSQLTAQDYTITDAAEVVQHAHRYCTLVQQGILADKARQTVASEALSAKPVGDEIGIESRRFYPNEVARTDDAWLDISRYAINAYYPHCGKLADLNSPVTPAPAPNTPTALPAPSMVPSSVAPPAPLSARDQQFLTVLQNMGLGYPSPDYAISHARATCDYMAKHPHDQAAADNYVAATTVWTGVNAVMFKDYSAVNYCSQFASE